MLIYPTLEIFAKLQQESRKWMNVVRAFEKSITNPKKYARSIESGLTYWCASIVPENTAEFMHSRMYQSVIYVLAGEARLELQDRSALKEVQKYDDTRDIQYFTDSVQTQEKSAITDQQLGAQAHAVRTRIDLSSLAQSAKKKEVVLKQGQILIVEPDEAWRIVGGAGSYVHLRNRKIGVQAAPLQFALGDENV